VETAYLGMTRPLPVCHVIREHSTDGSAADINASTRGLRTLLNVHRHAVTIIGVLGSANIKRVH